MSNLSMRSRLVFLVLLGLLLIGVGFAIYRVLHRLPDAPMAPPARTQEEIRADWSRGVQDALAEYDRTQDATKARDALLRLSVREADQSTHLALVLAFQGLIDRRANAAAALDQARRSFSSQ